MYTLGINAIFHDSAAALVRDGDVVAAAEEERFTRIKHAKRPVPFSAYLLPHHAIDYCLREAGIELADVDHVAYSFDPHILLDGRRSDGFLRLPLEPSAKPAPPGESVWEPLLLSYAVNAPRQLVDGVPHHLQQRFRGAKHAPRHRWHFVEHHATHEASAYLCSPFERCAVLTLDGRGERATTTYGTYAHGRYRRLGQVDTPHSLGLLYEAVTRHLGFLHSSDEYKVMALAAFGEPRYLEALREIVVLGERGRYQVRPVNLSEHFGPPRVPGGAIEERHRDLACSLQAVLEETVLEIAGWLNRATGEENLVMAGGVALNCVMNGRLQREGPFEHIWVQPAAGDAGTALGAALAVDAEQRGGERRYVMDHAYLGPQFGDDAIEAELRTARLAYRRVQDVAAETAKLLARNKVVGWFQGRMEFGPRALGARSILASPVDENMQARLNGIKDREDFRPVAPAVLEEAADEWFEEINQSPFMLFVHRVRNAKAARIPAVQHVDGTARVQTVGRSQHPGFHALISAFGELTGVPVLVNTSFNVRGEPIVCTPRDALAAFWTTPLDALAMGSFLLEKPESHHD